MQYGGLTDEQLVAAARNGDPDAFGALYGRYRAYVYGLAYRFTGDPDESLDVTQEVFTWLLRRLPSLEFRSRMSAYLYPAVRNVAISRARKRRPGVVDAQLLAVRPSPPPNADRFTLEVAEALQRLTAEQREVLLLRYLDGLTLADIADLLEMPIGTVKSRLYEAHRVLRPLL